MNDQIPDFEPPAPMFEDPKPAKKPRKKPTKRRKANKIVKGLKQAVAFSRGDKTKGRITRKLVKRRGRPAGVPNKPKLIELPASPAVAGQATSVLVILEVLSRYPSETRKEILDRARALA